MALIALAADKGSPGVTTAAVALGAVWPRQALLAEVDPAGGDLVYRCSAAHGGSLDPNTGMLSIAAMARRGLAAEQLWDHAQGITGGMSVLVGLAGAEQSTALVGQWGLLGQAFAALGGVPHAGAAADVLADCGRIGPDSPQRELLPHASLVLLLARSEPEYLARVRDRAAALTALLHGGPQGVAAPGRPAVGLLLIADPQSGSKIAGQVNEMLISSRVGARVMGVIGHDTAGAEQLAGRRRGRVEKSLLVRSVRRVAADLHRQYGAGWGAYGTGLPGQQPPTPAAPVRPTSPSYRDVQGFSGQSPPGRQSSTPEQGTGPGPMPTPQQPPRQATRSSRPAYGTPPPAAQPWQQSTTPPQSGQPQPAPPQPAPPQPGHPPSTPPPPPQQRYGAEGAAL